MTTQAQRKRDFQGRMSLGGAVLDLEGGLYSISSPILFPANFADFRIQRGSLVARSNYSGTGPEAYMLQIGARGACNSTSGGKNNKNCNSNVGVQQMTVDGGNRAWGGLLVEDTMNVNVGPAVMVVGVEGVGISLAGSGAGYIHEAWLGQFAPGAPTPRNAATATMILLAGAQHDCDVNNVIVFSGLVGVNSTNGANRLQGVHTWNLAGSAGGTGIRLHSGSGRVEQSYLDYAPLVVRVPGTKWSKSSALAMIEGNLFLGSSTVVLEAASPQAVVHGLVVTNNVFHSWNTANKTFVLDEAVGSVVGVVDTVVAGNEVGPNVLKISGKLSTQATMAGALTSTSSTSSTSSSSSVTLDFSDSMLFGAAVGIDPASVRCMLVGSATPRALSAQVKGNVVTVHVAGSGSDAEVADDDAAATVSCSVDQSTRSAPAH
eukprot:g361.t1